MIGQKRKNYIYTKFCLNCIHPEQWKYVTAWLQHEEVNYKVYRTAYRPDWHRKATKIWGNEGYEAFVVLNGRVIDFMEFAEECKNKLMPEGKEKNGGVLALQRTKRRNRKASAKVENLEAAPENED